MKKELIYRDDNAIAIYKTRLSEVMPLMQRVVDEYKDLNIKSELSPGGLMGLLKRFRDHHKGNVDIDIVKDFVRGVMASNVKNPSVEGVPIKHEAFKQMIAIPEVDRFAEALKRLIPYLGGQTPIWPNSFTIKEGIVVADKEELEKFESGCTHYAESPGEIFLNNKVKKLCDALNDHHELFNGQMRDTLPEPPIGITTKNNEYVPDETQIIGQLGQRFDQIAILEFEKDND